MCTESGWLHLFCGIHPVCACQHTTAVFRLALLNPQNHTGPERPPGWKIFSGSVKPCIGDESAYDQSLQRSQYHIGGFSLLFAQSPGESCRFIQRGFNCAPIHADEQRLVFKLRGFCAVALNDFVGVHRAKITTARPTHYIGKARVGIDQRSLNFHSGRLIQAMTVDYMRYFKTGQPNLTNASHFFRERIFIDVTLSMGEHAIAFAFADVKCLAISGINEAVYVVVKFFDNFRRKSRSVLLGHFLGILLRAEGQNAVCTLMSDVLSFYGDSQRHLGADMACPAETPCPAARRMQSCDLCALRVD